MIILLVISLIIDDNIYFALPFLLLCVSSLDDVAAVLLLGIAAELVVGDLRTSWYGGRTVHSDFGY